jgi:hypothetical protein
MQLFPNEEYLVRSNNDLLVLTTHRIQSKSKDWGSSYENTLFLEDISSIEIRYSSLFLALVIGIFLIVGGLIWSNNEGISPFNYSTIAGAFAILVYFVSRRHVISITPDGGNPINLDIGHMGSEEIHDFIDKVQLAKAARVNNLYHKG